MRDAAALPDELTGGPFTVARAAGLGIGPGRLRRRDLVTPFHGVRACGADDLLERCRSALLVVRGDARITHVTALRLLGVDVPWALEQDDDIHVLCAPVRQPELRGLRVHRLGGSGDRPSWLVGAGPSGRASTSRPAALPVTDPALTWRILSASLGVDELVVVGDALLRRRSPLTTPAALSRVSDEAPLRARGAARMRQALPDLRPGTDSSMETRARLVLVRGGLPCPEVNTPVLGRRGELLSMPDMLYRAQRIAVEYDGDVHRTDRATWRRDIARRERMQAAGWLVLTLTADDVQRTPTQTVHRIARALRERTP